MGRPAPQPVADESAKNIINAINAMADAQMAQTKLKQSMMLDQIQRQRNLKDNELKLGQERQNKKLETKDQIDSWNSWMEPAASGTQAAGVATSQTPNQTGSNPNAPIGGQAPAGGYSADQPAPMSMADGSNQLEIQHQMEKQQAVEQAKLIKPETPQVSSQYTELGFNPINIGQLALIRKGNPTVEDRTYIGSLQKAREGRASPGEIKMIKEFNGFKGDVSPLDGIDTVNLSPEQIGQELQVKNPGHYSFLESIKDGKYKITGRSSKEMNKVVEQIQTIWPGTDLQALQARYDVRKDFTSGKTANNITALNTALSHLDKLSNNADTLDNGAFRLGNKLGNILKTQTGDSRVRVLNSDIHAVTGELANTFKQSGATDQEIRNFQNSLDAVDSKEVVKSVVDEFIGLIGGRTQPLLERYQNAFGPEASFPVVGRAGQSVLQKHGFEWNPQTGDILKAGENNTPGGGDIKAQYNALRESGVTAEDAKKQLGL